MIEACSGPGRGPWWVGKNAIPSCVRRAAPWPGLLRRTEISTSRQVDLACLYNGRIERSKQSKTQRDTLGWTCDWSIPPEGKEPAIAAGRMFHPILPFGWGVYGRLAYRKMRMIVSPRLSEVSFAFIFRHDRPARRGPCTVQTSVGTIGRRAWRSSRCWWNDHSTLASLWDEGFFVTTTTRYEKQNDENAQMEVTITSLQHWLYWCGSMQKGMLRIKQFRLGINVPRKADLFEISGWNKSC